MAMVHNTSVRGGYRCCAILLSKWGGRQGGEVATGGLNDGVGDGAAYADLESKRWGDG